MATACVFCDAVQASPASSDLVVYADDLVLASHVSDEERPSYLGQLVLQTTRHVPGYADLTDDEAVSIGLATVHLSRALKATTGAEKIYVVTYAEVVPHLHTFLTSRYPGTPPQYWRMNIEQWPDAPRGDRQVVVALCTRIRTVLRSES